MLHQLLGRKWPAVHFFLPCAFLFSSNKASNPYIVSSSHHCQYSTLQAECHTMLTLRFALAFFVERLNNPSLI